MPGEGREERHKTRAVRFGGVGRAGLQAPPSAVGRGCCSGLAAGSAENKDNDAGIRMMRTRRNVCIALLQRIFTLRDDVTRDGASELNRVRRLPL